jgi:hypothetical protein
VLDACAGLPLSEKLYGAVPPVAVTVIVPALPVAQPAPTVAVVAVSCVGAVRVIEVVSLQPLASVMVTR